MCALQSRVQTDIEVQEAEPVVIDPVTHSWMATLPADGMRHHSRVFTDLIAGLFTDGKFARSLYSSALQMGGQIMKMLACASEARQ